MRHIGEFRYSIAKTNKLIPFDRLRRKTEMWASVVGFVWTMCRVIYRFSSFDARTQPASEMWMLNGNVNGKIPSSEPVFSFFLVIFNLCRRRMPRSRRNRKIEQNEFTCWWMSNYLCVARMVNVENVIEKIACGNYSPNINSCYQNLLIHIHSWTTKNVTIKTQWRIPNYHTIRLCSCEFDRLYSQIVVHCFR